MIRCSRTVMLSASSRMSVPDRLVFAVRPRKQALDPESGSWKTEYTRSLRPLAPGRLDIRRRLPDRMVWESGAETADTSRCTGVSTPQGGAYRPGRLLPLGESEFQLRLR